ncbi:DUF3426 domain-containing protein [Lysobacter sp. TY2-98]|uniref:DUF3426 domain-containing protein n=1 Tax=Lysobacter sp. TY2-98 TaxID=2290922 RepID=UPI000E1FDCE4|nr:DUF3426 domain-containing protein [Lysobacter sp. TY2-98]AXK72672.1 DUF3426 domain-containing protein [Lysobacter sp. TY2-98]
MFMPCPNCGFLVALIAGREMSQRCPRCGSALLSEGDAMDVPPEAPRQQREAAPTEAPAQVESIAAVPVDAVPPQRDALIAAPPAVERAEPRPVAPTIHNATIDATEDESDAAADSDIDTGIGTDLNGTRDDHLEVDASADDDADPTAAAAATRTSHDGPSFVRRRTARPRGRRWPLVAIVATLAVVFGLQLLLAQRGALAADARWRPLVMQTCGVLRCEVPAWHEPEAYRMLTRNVRPNPARPGVLHVTATVRNDARWPQPAPVIVLSLSDLDGRLVGARAVAPREYGQRVAALVAPGDSLDVAFDVREPASRVESYDFQLQ